MNDIGRLLILVALICLWGVCFIEMDRTDRLSGRVETLERQLKRFDDCLSIRTMQARDDLGTRTAIETCLTQMRDEGVK